MKKAVAAVIALILLFTCASADVMTIPDGVTGIEEEAFAGDTSLTRLALPDTVTAIGERAFAGCTGLGWATIPASVQTIGDAAFDSCAGDLLIATSAGSAAGLYARLNDVDYQAGTAYRALLIGQTYEGNTEVENLEGPDNDVAALRLCLENFNTTPWQVTVEMNLTAQGILDAVASAFSGATADDVSLFYYSGHGISSLNSETLGALVGMSTYDYVTASQLRAAMDLIPGRKVIIIDACYSGNFIPVIARSARGYSAEAAPTHVDFAESFIRTFSRRSRGAASGDQYFIMTAAAADEESFEYEYTVNGQKRVVGLFTSTLCEGCGYNEVRQYYKSLSADANGNTVITFDEVYRYVQSRTAGEDQTVQVYPAACDWFGLMRR